MIKWHYLEPYESSPATNVGILVLSRIQGAFIVTNDCFPSLLTYASTSHWQGKTDTAGKGFGEAQFQASAIQGRIQNVPHCMHVYPQLFYHLESLCSSTCFK
jgi:hypothetical protein